MATQPGSGHPVAGSGRPAGGSGRPAGGSARRSAAARPREPRPTPPAASTAERARGGPRDAIQLELIVAAVTILALSRLLAEGPVVWLVAILALAGIMAAGPSLSAAANAAVAAAAVTSTSARGSGTGAGPATGAQGSAAASTSGTNDDHLDAKPPRPAGARPNAVGRLDWRNRFDPRALDLRDLEMPTRIVPAVESAIVPGMLVAGGILAAQLLPFGYAALPALAIAAFVLDRAFSVERRWLADGPSSDDRLAILTLALVAAFVGFSGIAAFVHGGLVGFGLGVDGSSAGGTGTSGADAIDETALIVLAGADGLIAGILGYRLARLGPIAPREAVLSAVTYAAIIAIGAGLLRAMAVPHLLGPALLTLLVYLWDAFHATTPSIRRDPRWIWQIGLLVGLSVLVVGWNLALRS